MSYAALLGKLGGMVGGGGGLAKGGGLDGLNPGRAVGGSMQGFGKGLMSGGFEKAYTGGSQGGYNALMQGANLDHLKTQPINARAIMDQGIQEADLARAQRRGPATGVNPGLRGGTQ